ncbi:protein of unknown function [Haloarcula vallismortis]|uniref:DUF362 domain-containing protein n=2 Tax=Haloarcula vallismortis TaxID=28442 RepID=M0JQQ5_HALVA|nr:DUF362 domain-containing protein [Haloarcula vallismortis]EMA11462.1 hypothetical protein C437_01080 [Haloarcula vallismortis ATCC 29715]SDW42068.1 protein of unknown function [Haloarcula vallismortis]
MNFPNRGDVDHLIDPQPLPEFARVQYEPETAAVDDPSAAVRSEVDRFDFDGLEPGASVAVAVGSRGIHGIDDIAEAVVEGVRERGFEPVVVPAMGSHGGATPAGQREVLESLGITESRLGVPIDARMDTDQIDTVTVGSTEFPVHVSTAAQESDAVVVVNRVKPHTNYSGRIESGLTKMTVVGLGKQHGAKAFHSTAIKEGYVETLETALPAVEAALPLVGGVALVENFHEETAHVEAIPAGSFTDREPALLEQAYDEMATLPVDDIDLLVVDELGKDVSGAGMDTNVIGRYRVLNAPDPDEPSIKLLYARGLTKATKGNGNGIGLADITRRAAVDQLDLQKTYANALTSGSTAKAKLPLVAPDDEFAIQTALSALGGYDPDTARIVWIQTTQDLSTLHVSEPLIEDLPPAADVTGRESLAFTDGTASFTRD